SLRSRTRVSASSCAQGTDWKLLCPDLWGHGKKTALWSSSTRTWTSRSTCWTTSGSAAQRRSGLFRLGFHGSRNCFGLGLVVPLDDLVVVREFRLFIQFVVEDQE